jgi:hypothetical protein
MKVRKKYTMLMIPAEKSKSQSLCEQLHIAFLPIVGANIQNRNASRNKAFYHIAKKKLFTVRDDLGMFSPAKLALVLLLLPQNLCRIFHASRSSQGQEILVEVPQLALSSHTCSRNLTAREVSPIQTTGNTGKRGCLF